MSPDRHLFYPPPHAVAGIVGGVGCFGLSAVGLAVAAALFFSWVNRETIWSLKNACVGGSLGGFGLLLLGVAAHLWRLGRVPLVVQADGRVCFRGTELVAAGAARELVVRSKVVDGGDGPVEVVCLAVRLDGGERELPHPYFSGCGTREHALAMAGRIASALRIPVADGDNPGRE